MIDVLPISPDDVFSRPDLLDGYAFECGIQGLPVPCADQETYRALYSSGNLHLFGAFDDGDLIGFISFMVMSLPHYSQVCGINESFYVLPTHRNGGAGIQLLNKAERFAKERGALIYLVSAPIAGKLNKVMASRKDYVPSNVAYCKVLK